MAKKLTVRELIKQLQDLPEEDKDFPVIGQNERGQWTYATGYTLDINARVQPNRGYLSLTLPLAGPLIQPL